MSNQHWSSYIGCRSNTELHTSCVCSCTTSTSDRHHNTCQTVCPQLLKPVADTGWGRLAQRLTFCQEQELALEKVVSSNPVQPPGTLCHPISMTSLTLVLSENDSRMYFLIVLITDYCWRSWTYRIAAPYKFYVDWLTDWFLNTLETLSLAETNAGKFSFATGTSAIAAFLAIAEDCVFFRNWFHTFYRQ